MSQEKPFSDLVDVLDRAVARHPEQPLFGTKRDGRWEWIHYGDFGKRVAAFRGGLADLGVRQGDTVAVIAGNRVEWAVAAYAAYGLGAQYCPMYEHQHESDWKYILEDADAKVLLVSTYAIYERVQGWAGEGGIQHVACMALPAEDEASFLHLEARGAAKPAPRVDIDPSWVSGFIYTSGTTGKPKGVLLTHDNIVSNLNAVRSLFPIDHNDRSLCFLPWAHSFGQTCELHMMISHGASMAFAEAVDKLVDNFSEVKPTVLFAVPRVFNRIYDGLQKKIAEGGGLKKTLFDAGMRNQEKRAALAATGDSSGLLDLQHAFFDKLVFSKVRERFGGRLRFALSGGAALSPEVAHFIDKLGIFVCEGYGLTETSPIATANHPAARKIGSVGQAIPGVEIKIDTVGMEDVESKDGEVVVYGPNVMKGYHNRPEETAAVMTADGGFRTGDLGRLDEDGFLYITGRLKEQYKLQNGKYVVPAPLEEQIQLSPYVAQAFVDGANQVFNVALLVPDRVALEKWAREQGLAASYEELLDHPRTQELYAAQLEQYGRELKSYEKPKRFKLIGEEFSVDNNMLTPKMSLKRRVVTDRYADELAELHRE